MIAQATTLPQINAETLTTMRLPELWEVFAQVTGESSRCPNRNFLVRRILEVTHRSQPLSVPRPAIELVEDAPTDAQDAANDADDLADAESADDLADADGVDDFSDADEQAQPFLDEDDTAFAHAVNESDDDPEDEVADDADGADGEESADAEDDEIAEDEIDPDAFADEEEDPNALHVANEQISIPDSDKPAPAPEQATEANVSRGQAQIPARRADRSAASPLLGGGGKANDLKPPNLLALEDQTGRARSDRPSPAPRDLPHRRREVPSPPDPPAHLDR